MSVANEGEEVERSLQKRAHLEAQQLVKEQTNDLEGSKGWSRSEIG